MRSQPSSPAKASFGATINYGSAVLSYQLPTLVPDASILRMSTTLKITRAMGEVQILTTVVDLDTGFGNAVSVACAIVIQDKIFPKDSSLRSDGRHSLVSTAEFQGKIAVARATSSMLLITQIEALIAGLGEDEALRRGAA